MSASDFGISSLANLAALMGAWGSTKTIPSGADLDDYTSVGIYSISNAVSSSIKHSPYTGGASRVSVLNIGNVTIQYLTSYGDAPKIYFRAFVDPIEATWQRIDNYGTSTLSELASALGNVNTTTSKLTRGIINQTISTNSSLGGNRRQTDIVTTLTNRTAIVIVNNGNYNNVVFIWQNNSSNVLTLNNVTSDTDYAGLTYWNGGWRFYVYGTTDVTLTYNAFYFDELS